MLIQAGKTRMEALRCMKRRLRRDLPPTTKVADARGIYGQERRPIALVRTFALLRSGHPCDAHHVVGHVTDTPKVAYLPDHHQCRLVQIFIGLAQLLEGETVRPLDGAHADVGESNLA